MSNQPPEFRRQQLVRWMIGFVPPHVPPRHAIGTPILNGRSRSFRFKNDQLAGNAGLFILFWCSGITTIGPGEVGLVLRCGKLTGNFAGGSNPPTRIAICFALSN